MLRRLFGLALFGSLAVLGCSEGDVGGEGGGGTGPVVALPDPVEVCEPLPRRDADGGRDDDAGADAVSGAALPRNVVLLMGDGVGVAHWDAARVAAGGELAIDGLEGPVLYATSSLTSSGPTDSAAAATAIATGTCTFNGAVGVDGQGHVLPNLLELAQAAGKRVGLITNTTVIDATPMSFAVHTGHRYCNNTIAGQLFSTAQPDLLMGGHVPDTEFVGPGLAVLGQEAGYTVVRDLEAMAAAAGVEAPVLGLFGEGPSSPAWPDWSYGLTPEVLRAADSDEPTLAQMATFGLEHLARGEDGFLLVVENEHPDTIGHNATLDMAAAAALVPSAVLELDAALRAVLSWLEGRDDRDDTLIVVASDHECGGYELEGDDLAGATFPASPNHTAADVPLYARGPGASRLADVTHLSDIFHLVTGNLDRLPGDGACP